MEEVVKRWMAAVPDNWRGIDTEALAVLDLIHQTGISLVWVPRQGVIRSLLAAGKTVDASFAALAASSDAVLDDLEYVLGEVRKEADARRLVAANDLDGATFRSLLVASGLDPDEVEAQPVAELIGHAEASAFAAEGIAAARDGHFHAAQALAACGLGQVLHGSFEFSLLGAAFKLFRVRDLQEATFESMRVDALKLCTVRALTDYAVAPPEGFNRHATQHGERRFFSKANALAGLLLLVGWLRELKWVVENRPEVLKLRELGPLGEPEGE